MKQECDLRLYYGAFDGMSSNKYYIAKTQFQINNELFVQNIWKAYYLFICLVLFHLFIYSDNSTAVSGLTPPQPRKVLGVGVILAPSSTYAVVVWGYS